MPLPIIKKVSNNEIKSIIIGLIVSDDFCKDITPIFKRNPELKYSCFSGFHRIVLDWILDYYDSYKTSPKQVIQDIYKKKMEDLSNEEADMILEFLSHLDDKYEREKNYNEQYSIDQTKLFLRQKNIDILGKKIKEAQNENDIDEAERLVAAYKQIEYDTEIYQITDIFNDVDDIDECIHHTEDLLFKLPGTLGDTIGWFVRGDFLAVVGPSKRGKSWHLLEVSVQAALNNFRVLHFNCEMSHNKCRKRIYQNFLGEVANIDDIEKGFSEISIPYFEDDGSGVFDIRYKKKEKFGLDSKRIKRKITTMNKMFKGNLKLISFPAGALTLSKIVQICDEFALSGFPADVISVDYADILADEKGKEHRHQIDYKWRGLRGVAQQTHSLVVTGSHASKATFKKDIGQDNLSEDYRKLNHVTLAYGLNQSGEDIDNGIMRINILAHRDKRFNPNTHIALLQSLDIGKCHLASKFLKEVNYEKD